MGVEMNRTLFRRVVGPVAVLLSATGGIAAIAPTASATPAYDATACANSISSARQAAHFAVWEAEIQATRVYNIHANEAIDSLTTGSCDGASKEKQAGISLAKTRLSDGITSIASGQWTAASNAAHDAENALLALSTRS
jgi:hypothetical protein